MSATPTTTPDAQLDADLDALVTAAVGLGTLAERVCPHTDAACAQCVQWAMLHVVQSLPTVMGKNYGINVVWLD